VGSTIACCIGFAAASSRVIVRPLQQAFGTSSDACAGSRRRCTGRSRPVALRRSSSARQLLDAVFNFPKCGRARATLRGAHSRGPSSARRRVRRTCASARLLALSVPHQTIQRGIPGNSRCATTSLPGRRGHYHEFVRLRIVLNDSHLPFKQDDEVIHLTAVAAAPSRCRSST